MSVQVFRNNTLFANQSVCQWRKTVQKACFSVFILALVYLSASTTYITCITQATLKFIDYTLVNNGSFNLMQF